MIFKLVLLASFYISSIIAGPTVETPLGLVEGVHNTSYLNNIYSAFYSIPYALPPVGELRFKHPHYVTPWDGVFKADTVVKCPQVLNREYVGQEDCLRVNVFTPFENPTGNENLQVLVDIHGGAFMFGHGADYSGPDYMMDKNVVLVTLNYRLGALGFLSTEDGEVAGNMGLKDQVLALIWVQRNIKAFGGDPDQVTILGLSAGGASVSYHYLTKLSDGLFNNGISISGSPMNPWAFQDKAAERAKELGKELECPTENTTVLVECLRTKPAKEIAIRNGEVFLGQPFSPYAPVVEKDCLGAFICKHPYQILKDGEMNKRPIIYSVVADEGLYPALYFLDDDSYLPYLDKHWIILCPFVFDFNHTLTDIQKEKACDDIKSYYLKDEPVSLSTFQPLQKAMTDRLFVHGVENNAKLHAKYNDKVYFYRYNYTTASVPTFAKLFSPLPRQGISHGDDIMMLYTQFHLGWPKFELHPDDQKMQDIFFDLYLSFAKTGVPESKLLNTEWLPVDGFDGMLNHLHIDGPDAITLENKPTIAHAEFWESIPFKENELYSVNSALYKKLFL